MSSALASLYTGRKVRSDTAMTGEITLSGLVFPIGGLKEKVLAAFRAGIRRIILPYQNEADVEDIPQDVRNQLEFIPVARISEVLAAALETEVSQPPAPSYLPQSADGKLEREGERLIAREKEG
jgi:ATP-dependent Lon protease